MILRFDPRWPRWISRYRRACRASKQAGFTLVELLVVLGILGLLVGLAAPRVIGYLGSSNTKTARIQLGNIEASLDLYRLDQGRYPESLEALVSAPANADRWNGPYLKKSGGIVDPWGRQYGYKFPGDHGDYDLYSLGADGSEGGEDENQDVRSW